MKKYVSILAVLLIAAALSVSLGGCASTPKAADGSFTIDFTKAKGSSLENTKQSDGSMFWIDNSWADFDRSLFKGVAPSVRWIYSECPVPDRNKWWQGFGANDVKWNLAGFTHVTITYMASRGGDSITFTMSEAHQAQAREASTVIIPEVANEWVELKLALADFTTPEGMNYLNKQFAPPTWSNITGWLFGAGTVPVKEEAFFWVDSIVFTNEGTAQSVSEVEEVVEE